MQSGESAVLAHDALCISQQCMELLGEAQCCSSGFFSYLSKKDIHVARCSLGTQDSLVSSADCLVYSKIFWRVEVLGNWQKSSQKGHCVRDYLEFQITFSRYYQNQSSSVFLLTALKLNAGKIKRNIRLLKLFFSLSLDYYWSCLLITERFTS